MDTLVSETAYRRGDTAYSRDEKMVVEVIQQYMYEYAAPASFSDIQFLLTIPKGSPLDKQIDKALAKYDKHKLGLVVQGLIEKGIVKETKYGGFISTEMFLEPFSECPNIPEAKEMIDRTNKYMQEKHPKDSNESEVAAIGHNYTFHTHPRGTLAPSDPDIETTRKLRKNFLCIGLVPQKKVICYDSGSLQKTCEHPA